MTLDNSLDNSLDGTLSDVIAVLAHTLAIEDRAAFLDAGTPLLGSLPELDSLAVVELAVALEARFGIVIDDADFTGEVFETIGSLSAFVADRRA